MVAPYGNGNATFYGNLQPFVKFGDPFELSPMEFSPGTGGAISGIHFYPVNEVGTPTNAQLAPGSETLDFAIINTLQDLCSM